MELTFTACTIRGLAAISCKGIPFQAPFVNGKEQTGGREMPLGAGAWDRGADVGTGAGANWISVILGRGSAACSRTRRLSGIESSVTKSIKEMEGKWDRERSPHGRLR